MNAWLTPDNVPNEQVLDKCLKVPAHLAHFVIGAIQELTKPHNFEQHGSMTVDEVVEKMWGVYESYLEECSMSIVGEIRMFARTIYPAGWLPCDGNVYDKVDYPELSSYLGAGYEYDNDRFYVPNFKGRFPRGVNNDTPGGEIYGPDTDGGQYNGETGFTISINEMPSHTHFVVVNNPSLLLPVAPGPELAQGASPYGAETSPNGGGNPINFEPASVTAGFAIYAGV